MKLKKVLSLSFFMMLMMSFAYAQNNDIIGYWKTIDDETGEIKSVVKIYKNSKGYAYGMIKKLYRKAGEDQDPSCTKCKDYRKDKKIVGMVIVTDMKKVGSKWVAGKILDPKKGKIYRCSMWVEGGKLQVRGHLGPVHRTQTWLPYPEYEKENK